MISIGDLSKFLAPIRRKIFLMIGRGILAAIKNTEKTMKIQITGLNGETITDIERLQEYGFESYPKTDSEAEVLTVYQNGNRDQGIALVVHDRAYRPTDLVEGNVRVYDYNNNKISLTDDGIELEDLNGNKITKDSNGIIILDANNNKVTLDSNGVIILDVNNNKVEMKSGEINITGTKINLLNAVEAFVNGTTFDTWITSTLLTIFNAHTHAGVTPGPGVTGVTATPLTPPAGHLSTTIKGS